MIYASTVDLDEAYKIGQNAVSIAIEHGSGFMSTLLRRDGLVYSVDYEKVPLELVANSEREFPKEWIDNNRFDVTDEFVRYARPLIGEDWVSVPIINGIQRFTKFEKVFADQKLPVYTPEAYLLTKNYLK
jgi:6-phosphofructokinase 1